MISFQTLVLLETILFMGVVFGVGLWDLVKTRRSLARDRARRLAGG